MGITPRVFDAHEDEQNRYKLQQRIRALALAVAGSVCLWLPEGFAQTGSGHEQLILLSSSYPWFMASAALGVAVATLNNKHNLHERRSTLFAAALMYGIGLGLPLLLNTVNASAPAETHTMLSDSTLLLAITTLFEGMGFGILMMGWGMFYVDLPLRSIKVIIFAVALVQPLLGWGIGSMPANMQIIAYAPMPLISYATLMHARNQVGVFGRELQRLPRRSVPIRGSYIAGVSSISLCFGALNMLFARNNEALSPGGTLILGLLIMLAVATILFSKRADTYVLSWQVVAFAMIVGFACVLAFQGTAFDGAFCIAYIGYGVFEYLLWVASVDLAKYARNASFRFIAFTFMFTIGGQAIGATGAWCLEVMAPNTATALTIVAMGGIILAAAAAMWLLPSSAVRELFASSSEATNLESARESVPTKAFSRQREEALRADFDLTAREAEVAMLLMSGRSARFIQEQLCISEGTAWTHIRHIYRKMGVSSRQEFLTVAERAGEQTQKGYPVSQ